jgi:hypothetical protein
VQLGVEIADGAADLKVALFKLGFAGALFGQLVGYQVILFDNLSQLLG